MCWFPPPSPSVFRHRGGGGWVPAHPRPPKPLAGGAVGGLCSGAGWRVGSGIPRPFAHWAPVPLAGSCTLPSFGWVACRVPAPPPFSASAFQRRVGRGAGSNKPRLSLPRPSLVLFWWVLLVLARILEGGYSWTDGSSLMWLSRPLPAPPLGSVPYGHPLGTPAPGRVFPLRSQRYHRGRLVAPRSVRGVLLFPEHLGPGWLTLLIAPAQAMGRLVRFILGGSAPAADGLCRSLKDRKRA